MNLDGPYSGISSDNGITDWVTPNAVMKTRKLKARRQALNARLNGSLPVLHQPKREEHLGRKSFPDLMRNPFR